MSKYPSYNKIIEAITVKKTAIYCRVSTANQVNGVSLQVQEEECTSAALRFGLRVRFIQKEVCSAYNGKRKHLKRLIKDMKGGNIIIFNVSRFARSVNDGYDLLQDCLNHKVRLFFVEEGIVFDNNFGRQYEELIRTKLEFAEAESQAIGNRRRSGAQYKKARGFHTGGRPKYGYTTQEIMGGKKLVPVEAEQRIIAFINMCLTIGTRSEEFNQLLSEITGNPAEYVLEHEDNDADYLIDPLSYKNIAYILQDEGIQKRGKQWTAQAVANIAKRNLDDLSESMMRLGV